MSEVSQFRALTFAAGLFVTSVAIPGAQPAAAATTAERFLAFCPTAIIQNFPTTSPAETTWLICWREVAGENSIADPNGLVIGPVYFRKSPNADFVRILWDMRVSEYFVPYHSGSPRYYDLSHFNFKLTGVTAADCPAPGGTPIGLAPTHVCKEVHDRGLMWKDFSGVKRGEELVLWGAIDAWNYRYIQEYTFRDDGIIMGRMGATGQNLPSRETSPHAHNAIWRIDIDLDGTRNNAARLQHIETPALAGSATDTMTPIAMAKGFTWEEETHDAVEITNPSFNNAQQHPASYQLIPLVTGGGRTQHFGMSMDERFTQNDFWVTPFNTAQFAAKDLPTYVAAAPSVANRDIVVWYKGSLHHHPRDEDAVPQAGLICAFSPPSPCQFGTAHAMWTGFMLVPHDFFDCSPFYPAMTRECPLP